MLMSTMFENEKTKMAMSFDLEERLIAFAASILTLAEGLPATRACNHLSSQLIRSGTAPALIYAEARGAESTNDFIHKMSLALKELRETWVCLSIIKVKGYKCDGVLLDSVLEECNQLKAIFGKSINTAKRKREVTPM
jgi:four helix bundle protein